jgi:7-cyano-7-deazaguanine tRNA-ribosyltransferase
MKFEIKDRDASGRICNYTTKHGRIKTPTILPVINPNRMLISPKEMKNLFGTEIVITNSYIIFKDEKLRAESLDKGVHKLIDFNGPIMTDSGTFQSYVYGDIDIDPIKIVEFQRDIGSDIGTILDIFSTPDQSKSEVEQVIKETVKRAKKSVKLKRDMALACTVQGSIFPDLRHKCAKQLSKIDSDFFPIGGVVPLMENQRYADLVRCIINSRRGLNPSKPVHLFGAGHPLIFPLAVALGCDFFDSSAYAKYANDERFLFSWGTEKLDNLNELPCNCPICSKYTTSELKRIDKKNKTKEIAKHNLYVTYRELKKIRNAISNGSLWELVERRANSNPYLMDALRELRRKENKEFLEISEPTSKKKALFYSGYQTIHRPEVYRIHKRLLERYKTPYDTTIVFPEGTKPYSVHYSEKIKRIFKRNCKINILIDSNIGPVPLELDEMYPFAQSIFPDITDKETEEYVTRIFDEFTKNENIICWIGSETLKDFKSIKEKCKNFDFLRISAISDMQFGKGAGNALLSGNIRIVKSKKTGKIRNVFSNEKHILSMRAEDGQFTLKLDGASILHDNFKYPKLRVVIDKDSLKFVKDGKSVFSKFVIDCDPELRPYDECLIVDEKDELIAVGRCILNKIEMLSFNYGMAVKTRESFN